MKAYKIELLVIDFDRIGEDDITEVIESTNYPNDCIDPHVMSIEERDIGEWKDDHPLNSSNKFREEYQRLFKKGKP